MAKEERRASAAGGWGRPLFDEASGAPPVVDGVGSGCCWPDGEATGRSADTTVEVKEDAKKASPPRRPSVEMSRVTLALERVLAAGSAGGKTMAAAAASLRQIERLGSKGLRQGADAGGAASPGRRDSHAAGSGRVIRN